MRANMIEFDAKLPHAPRHGPPNSRVQEWSPRAALAKADLPIVTLRSGIAKVFEDCLSHFVLNRELLNPAAFAAPHCEYFAAPIEVIQMQVYDLAAAKSVDSKKQQEGFGAKLLGFRP